MDIKLPSSGKFNVKNSSGTNILSVDTSDSSVKTGNSYLLKSSSIKDIMVVSETPSSFLTDVLYIVIPNVE
jgi:hypothetical protein